MRLEIPTRTSFVTALPSLAILSGCGVGQADPAAEGASKPWPGETWPTSTPAAQGIDAAAIDSLVADIEAGEYGLVDAFMLIRNGMVVANHRFSHDYAAIGAEYDTTNHQYNYDHPDWHPYLRGTELHTLQSVTKSITSAALGIAMDEGLLGGVDTPVMSFFEAYEPYATDERKEATTLEDFLTMRSGLRWITTGGYSSALHSTIQLEASDGWIRFVLETPTDTTPGSRYQYNDGVSVLLGKVLREATGQRIDQWAKERLFEPIGITDFHWKITPDGEADTEGGLYLSTEDLARIGYLFLRGGEWNGRQIVSREWVEASTSPVVRDVAPDNGRPDPGYGYQWWVPDHEGGTTRVFAGNGYGGQFVLVSPEHDIVVVFNGWNIHGGANRQTRRALQERILPHVELAR
ncbi:MAG: serine hydrolase [Gemmatimonadetes bacterium]|nr:serine hydrolase [Gemmatimonadota bacterium]